MVKVYGTPIFL
jgi:hypothetical protein